MKNKISSDNEWKEELKKLNPTELLSDKEEIKKLLSERLIQAVKERVPNKKFGILFSGGVDSSTIALICKILKKDFICYTVGIGDYEDLKYAKEVAKKFNFKLKTKIFDIKDIEKNIKILAKIIPNIDVIKMGVGLVTYSCLEMAKKDNIDVMFSGLGSEEIFAGYQRHLEAKDVNKECYRGLLEINSRDIIRDYSIGNHFDIKIETPFLDKELIKLALKIPAKFKLGKENKMILRDVSYDFGLEEYSFRKKRAAQYGSNFDKAIIKISKKNGFKFKSDYIKSLNK